MYERFTGRAREIMALAEQEASDTGQEFIGTEHILLGLVREGSGVAANVLRNMSVDLLTLRIELAKLVAGESSTPTFGAHPLTPRANHVVDYALEEARRLNHNYVGTEHLLLGLLREHEGEPAQILTNLGLGPAAIRKECLNLLGHELQ
jgi:ATP-dependent Clp protease ATP-binding subunit ClpC